ncbi:hypothetical protein ACH5RR_010964 [Cinchona calisaya]|uniref:Sister chromatid cohesion 1 protein 2 n=1 Tax=Cinchona calisaya TaxID=153742 RepID=A0ABD3A9C6_9GENT
MFYSQWLLSKKVALGTIWVAAHCHKRLKKDQVKQTDISSSVDRILHDEVPVVTYRILAYLLLGVVRIFSKKVDFLFYDCRDVMKNLCDFAGGKKAHKSIEAMRTSYSSITRPKHFELDAFDLEVFVDQDVSSCNVRAPEEIMLADTLRWGVELSNDKYYCPGENSLEVHSSMCTPVKDVYSPHFMDIDTDVTPLSDMNELESRLKKLHGIRFSLEERLEPIMLLEADMPSNEGHQTDGELIQNLDTGAPAEIIRLLDKEKSMEKLRGTNFLLEESLGPRVFSDGGKESILYLPSNEEHQTDGEQIKNLDSRINVMEPETLIRSFDKEQNLESEDMRLPKMTPATNQITAKHPMAITIDAILDSELPGAASPEFIAVCTPATKERARVLKKRKCFFDETIVLSNNVVKRWIDDSSDLVCKRRKAPHTAFHAWRSHKLSNLPQGFMKPIIPCNSVAFVSLVSERKLTRREPVETAEIHVSEVIAEIPVNQVVAVSPVLDRSHEQTPIAPATPVSHSTSLRLHEVQGISKPEISFESIERQLTPNEDQELDVALDEELNSCSGDISGKSKCSVRARKVARYLYEKFQERRRDKGDMLMNLTQVLKGKSRRESARLFYEILVLKTGDYIDVRQENAFGDILVLETPVLQNFY